LTLQIRCPRNRGKTFGRQKAGDVLHEDTGDISLERTGPSVEIRKSEFILAGAGHYLRPVKIVGYANRTYGNHLGFFEGSVTRDRGPVLYWT
jgi:hypothetical protein